jgi:hypothetical protein
MLPALSKRILDFLHDLDRVQRDTAIAYDLQVLDILTAANKAEQAGLSGKAKKQLTLLEDSLYEELEVKSVQLGVSLRRFTHTVFAYVNEHLAEISDEEWAEFKNFVHSGNCQANEIFLRAIVSQRTATVFLRQFQMKPSDVTEEKFLKLNRPLKRPPEGSQRTGVATVQAKPAWQIESELWRELSWRGL